MVLDAELWPQVFWTSHTIASLHLNTINWHTKVVGSSGPAVGLETAAALLKKPPELPLLVPHQHVALPGSQ